MITDDLVLGLRLSRQAGWNQTEADWLRLLYFEPDGCFIAELDEIAVGTTTTCVFGHVAWVAMVLVDVAARNKGIGTQLLCYALDYLDDRQVLTVRLDATPAGKLLYEKLGFQQEYELARYEGIASCCEGSPIAVEATPETYPDIIELDRKMTGTNREKLLARLFDEFPHDLQIIRRHGVDGYAIKRPGANAIQVGPCVAGIKAGSALLSDVLHRSRGKPVFVDVPRDNVAAVKLVESTGLRIQRCFVRMYRGKRVDDKVEALWAGSGPEKG
jgi:ribosomal protein S18 acetylase RimI-like enzyme